MARILAVANQKGGVGKTTTAVNLAACLAEAGKKTLIVDLDPQGNATVGLGIDRGGLSASTYELLMGSRAASEAVRHISPDGLALIPSSPALAGAEIELVPMLAREQILSRALAGISSGYDFVFLDCPPSLGLLTVNALVAAAGLLVPIQCEYYALEGISALLETVRRVQASVNPSLSIYGILLTMADARTNLTEQVIQNVRGYFGDLVFQTVIPRNVRLSEAPGFGKPITSYDPTAPGAAAYRALAKEVIEREEAGPGQGTRGPDPDDAGQRRPDP